jgi:purine nucleosidase
MSEPLSRARVLDLPNVVLDVLRNDIHKMPLFSGVQLMKNNATRPVFLVALLCCISCGGEGGTNDGIGGGSGGNDQTGGAASTSGGTSGAPRGGTGGTALGGSGGTARGGAGGTGGTAPGGSAGVSMGTGGSAGTVVPGPSLPHLIIDSDANNEMDDQHAIAYALFNANLWRIDGITTNATKSGGAAPEHTKEAVRVVALSASEASVKVYTGATGNYEQIRSKLGDANYDGKAAVDFIIARAKLRSPTDKLILMPIGKLTNVALAFDKDPSITKNIHVFWLGSNWPNDGEYNLEDDPAAATRVVDSDVELDIATVRYDGRPQGGTAAVTVTLDQMKANMKGKGPAVAPVTGRNGGTFTRFGDYSIDLMSHIGSDVRALYDMAAVAIVKNPKWATVQEIPAPSLSGIKWTDRPNNPRKIRMWHSFNQSAIVKDLFDVMTSPKLQQ